MRLRRRNLLFRQRGNAALHGSLIGGKSSVYHPAVGMNVVFSGHRVVRVE